MRIERVQAKQGHPVPAHAGRPLGPFPPELAWNPEVVVDYEPLDDGGSAPLPEGATAQNSFRPRKFRWFRCDDCGETLREDELDNHDCDDWDEDDWDEDDEDFDDEDFDDDEDED